MPTVEYLPQVCMCVCMTLVCFPIVYFLSIQLPSTSVFVFVIITIILFGVDSQGLFHFQSEILYSFYGVSGILHTSSL